MIQQIERNDGKSPHAMDVVGEKQHGKEASRSKAELPPVGLSDAMREKLETAIKSPDRTNTLPVPERKLGLELG